MGSPGVRVSRASVTGASILFSRGNGTLDCLRNCFSLCSVNGLSSETLLLKNVWKGTTLIFLFLFFPSLCLPSLLPHFLSLYTG